MALIVNEPVDIVASGVAAQLVKPNGHTAAAAPPDAVIGVLAHNEEANIEACLRSILNQQPWPSPVRSVIVIASGCTDRTAEIVRELAGQDDRLRLVVEPHRSGKPAAINLLLSQTSETLCVILGGDIILTPGSIAKLLLPFSDSSVGMTGARPVPTNARSGLVGNMVHILWDLHHEIAMASPKLGETVVFRRVFEGVDPSTLVDEPSIEQLILSRGLHLQYVPEAIVRNRGPENVRDLLRQRARIHRGYLALAWSTGYRPSSLDISLSVRVAWKLWRQGAVRGRYYLAAAGLEAAARTIAIVSMLTRLRNAKGVWRPIPTSKRVVIGGQTLRTHYMQTQTLLFDSIDLRSRRREQRAAMRELKHLLRKEDELRSKGRQITARLCTNLAGARVAQDRLRAEFPRWHVRVSGEIVSAEEPISLPVKA